MKNPLRKILVLFSAFAALAVSAFAQDVAAKVPDIQVQKVDFKVVQMPNADPAYKWGQTKVEFKVNATKDYLPSTFLNNVKLRVTLVYDKTAASLSSEGTPGSRARGSKGKAMVEKAVAESGGGQGDAYTYYRAAVTFAALKVNDGKKEFTFYIPGEIVERDKEKMPGNAKPKFYYIEFEYNDMVIGAFDAAGKRRANYIDPQIKEVKHFEQLCNWADAAVSETKGIFLPAYLTPGGYGFLKAAPSVVRDEVQQ